MATAPFPCSRCGELGGCRCNRTALSKPPADPQEPSK